MKIRSQGSNFHHSYPHSSRPTGTRGRRGRPSIIPNPQVAILLRSGPAAAAQAPPLAPHRYLVNTVTGPTVPTPLPSTRRPSSRWLRCRPWRMRRRQEGSAGRCGTSCAAGRHTSPKSAVRRARGSSAPSASAPRIPQTHRRTPSAARGPSAIPRCRSCTASIARGLRALQRAYALASAAFRRGDFSAEFPRFMFRPSVPLLPSGPLPLLA